MEAAEHREPCESRGSCTDLGAPGGEIPPGDSTASLSTVGIVQRHLVPHDPTSQMPNEAFDQSHTRPRLILQPTSYWNSTNDHLCGLLDAQDSPYLRFGFPTRILGAKNIDLNIDAPP